MKTLIAKVHGHTVATKKVEEVSPLELHQFMFETSRQVTRKFQNDIKISVKGSATN